MVYIIIRSTEYVGDEVVGVLADKGQAAEIVQRLNAECPHEDVFWHSQEWELGDVIE